MYICMYVHVYVFVYVCTYLRVYVCTYAVLWRDHLQICHGTGNDGSEENSGDEKCRGRGNQEFFIAHQVEL